MAVAEPDNSPPRKEPIVIVTDGCRLNPQAAALGIGSWAAIIIDNGERVIPDPKGTSPATTAMHMEIQAVVEALSRVPKNAPVHLVTDVMGISQTLRKVRKRQEEGKNPYGPLKSGSMWSPLVTAFVEHPDVTCKVHRSHNAAERHPLQREVHNLCSEAARELQRTMLGHPPEAEARQR